MSTFYCDLESGNDANDGTTFANRWLTLTNGATAARIAPADTIRIKASPDPTSLGSALWTNTVRDSLLPATSSISAVSNATPIQITTSTNHGLSTGDIVVITGQTGNRYINGLWIITRIDNTNFTLDGSLAAGAGGTATGTVRLYTTRAIKLTTACNKTIDMCEVQWTASANVTTTVSTTNKQGDGSANIAFATAFTTGKAAYRTLPATLDLSTYEQVTLWIRFSANIPAGRISLRLCSDTIGDTTVNNLAIPALNGTNAWIPITINNGSALGASIASIAIYADTDPSTLNLTIDNIIAVKSSSSNDSLGLQSLIGKNTSDETFYPICSIEEQVISLDCGNSFLPSGGARHMGYYGITETVTTYKLEPISLASFTIGTEIGLTLNDSGTAGNLITFSGGWNRTDMSTQVGFSWIDCRNGLNDAIFTSNQTFIKLEKIGIVRSSRGISGSITDSQLSNIHLNGNTTGLDTSGSRITADNIFLCNNFTRGANLGSGSNIYRYVDWGNAFKKINCNGGQRSTGGLSAGLTMSGDKISFGVIYSISGNYVGDQTGAIGTLNQLSQVTIDEITNLSANIGAAIHSKGAQILIHKITSADGNESLFNMYHSGDIHIHELHSSNSAIALNSTATSSTTAGVAEAHVRRWTSTSDAIINNLLLPGVITVSVERFGDVAGDNRIYVPGCNISTESSIRHTASGVSWKFEPVSTSLITSAWPAEIPIARFAVTANKQVTVTAWVRRSHTELTIGIKIIKLELLGISTEISDSITVAADTWEQLSIQLTPTEDGVVELLAFAHGGTTRIGYIDDINITRVDGPSQSITLDRSYHGFPSVDMPSSSGGVFIRRRYIR